MPELINVLDNNKITMEDILKVDLNLVLVMLLAFKGLEALT